VSLGAILPWYGAKRALAAEIVQELGVHNRYWEPFCGSMAVLFAKPPSQFECVNDLHGDLINLARVIQDERLGPQLYRRLRRTWVSEELHAECCAALANGESDPLHRAFCFFVQSWMGLNGMVGKRRADTSFSITYDARAHSPGKRWCTAVDSIPAWRRRMRSVIISQRDAFELLTRIQDASGVAIYCDPPYLVKHVSYAHDFTREDHERLAAILQRFRKARVVVSYYAHPELYRLYPGWTMRRFNIAQNLSHSNRKRDCTRAQEVLLLNGPSRVPVLF
jgi:DNA adenine methylase